MIHKPYLLNFNHNHTVIARLSREHLTQDCLEYTGAYFLQLNLYVSFIKRTRRYVVPLGTKYKQEARLFKTLSAEATFQYYHSS